MRAMHWTLPEYRNAPHSLIEELWLFLQTEDRARADLMKRQNGSD